MIMMNDRFHIFLCFGLLLNAAGVYGQQSSGSPDLTKSLNQKSMEEFGVKKDSSNKTYSLPPAEKPAVNSTKDLNALEKQKIESLELKSKPVSNHPDSLYWYYKRKWEDSVAQAEKLKKLEQTLKAEEPQLPAKVVKPAPVKPAPVAPEKQQPVQKPEPVKAEEPTLPEKKTVPKVQEPQQPEKKPVPKAEEPKLPAKKPEPKAEEPKVPEKKPLPKAEEPVLPSKKPLPKAEEPKLPAKTPAPKQNLDSMLKKPVKDFTFETQPIINDGSSNVKYSPDKPAKPEPKTNMPVKLSPEQEKQRQEMYNAYQREADSARDRNQRYLDSVLAALQVKLPIKVDPKDYIEIYVSGGGVQSGNDPRLTDRVSVFQSGVIQREYSTKLQGEFRTEKKISRDELLKLAQYIADLGFFDYQPSYACGSNTACANRSKLDPIPRPLTITVAIGKRRHTVNTDILVPGEQNWTGCPSGLEKILIAVSSLADK